MNRLGNARGGYAQMATAAKSTTGDDQRKRPLQFSIAFLLWLTMASAFVLGIATWTPESLVLLPLAAAIPAIITWAYRRGRRAFGVSIIGGAVATGIAYGDWFVHDRALRQMPGESDESIFVFSHACHRWSPRPTGHCLLRRQIRENKASSKYGTTAIVRFAR